MLGLVWTILAFTAQGQFPPRTSPAVFFLSLAVAFALPLIVAKAFLRQRWPIAAQGLVVETLTLGFMGVFLHALYLFFTL